MSSKKQPRFKPGSYICQAKAGHYRGTEQAPPTPPAKASAGTQKPPKGE